MIELEHLNFGFEPKMPSLDLINCSSNILKHHFFEHRKDLNMYIFLKPNSNTLFLASNDRTLNFKHSRIDYYQMENLRLKMAETTVR